ncbi:antiterminator regulatory protein [Escherichia coli]|nr:antiterminator regulatory protein [Escherichia coli]
MPLLHLLRQNPVIAAVKDNASLQLAIDSECQFISVLYGNICTISNIVKKIKNAGKYAFIHVDLLEGASNKEVVIQFLKLVTEADGIISTKASMLKAARAEGFFCIHRLFIVDSISFHNIDKQVAQSNPVRRRTKNTKTFHEKCENLNFRTSSETVALFAVFLFI